MTKWMKEAIIHADAEKETYGDYEKQGEIHVIRYKEAVEEDAC